MAVLAINMTYGCEYSCKCALNIVTEILSGNSHVSGLCHKSNAFFKVIVNISCWKVTELFKLGMFLFFFFFNQSDRLTEKVKRVFRDPKCQQSN